MAQRDDKRLQRKLKLGHQGVKSLTDGARIDEMIPQEGKQRRIGGGLFRFPSPSRKKVSQQVSNPRAERHESALIELGLPDDEEATLEVYIPDTESSDLAYSEPQPIKESKDSAVDPAPHGGPCVVFETTGHFQQATRSGRIKDKGDSLGRLPFGRGLEGRPRQETLLDQPVEEAPDRTQQMVVTARSCAGA